jgi:hypothetical protein
MLVEEDLELFWDLIHALSKNQEFITCQDFLLQNQ